MPKIQWDGDAASVVRAQEAMQKAVKAYKEEVDKSTKSAAAMEKAAQRIAEQVNPQERLNRKMRELTELVGQNKLSVENAARALVKYQQDASKATETGRRRWKEQAEAAAAAVRQQGELNAQGARIKQSLETPLESYKRKLLELGRVYRAGGIDQATFVRGARQLKDELAEATPALEETKKGFLGSITAVVDLTRVVSLLNDAFQETERKSQAAADAVFNSLSSAGELQQIAANKTEFQALLAESRGLVARGVFGSEQQRSAFDAVANLQNANFNAEERSVFYQAAATRIIAPENLTAIGGRIRGMQDLFGSEDTGSVKETLDKTLAAANATQENVAQTGEVIPKFGSEAKAIGVDFETSLAAYVAVREQTANADRTADRLKSFFNKIDSEGLSKGSLYETVDEIAKQVADGKTAKSILGDDNAVAGFRVLATPKARATFAARYKEIAGAVGMADSRSFIDADPRLSSALSRSQEQGALSMMIEEQEAERESLYDAVVAAHQRRDIRLGAGRFKRFLGSSIDYINDVIGNEHEVIANAAQLSRRDPNFFSSADTAPRIEAYLERMAQGIDELNGKRAAKRAVQTAAGARKE